MWVWTELEETVRVDLGVSLVRPELEARLS